MSTLRGRATLVCVVLLVLLSGLSPAYAVRVGWNVDIHQGKYGGPNDPDQNNYANDFHIWGVLESWGYQPSRPT